IPADLLGVDVEGGDELDVADVVVTEAHVHQARHPLGRVRVAVVVNALHQRGGAVTDADDGDTYGAHTGSSLSDRHDRPRDSGGGVAVAGPCGGRPERSLAISSSSQRTSRSQASRPWRCNSSVYASSRSAARLNTSRSPSRRSSTLRRRPSRIRSRVARSVRAKNAKCTPNPVSSQVSGPVWASSSPNRSLPSAVIL